MFAGLRHGLLQISGEMLKRNERRVFWAGIFLLILIRLMIDAIIPVVVRGGDWRDDYRFVRISHMMYNGEWLGDYNQFTR